jgi:signal transduction histidine kinase
MVFNGPLLHLTGRLEGVSMLLCAEVAALCGWWIWMAPVEHAWALGVVPPTVALLLGHEQARWSAAAVVVGGGALIGLYGVSPVAVVAIWTGSALFVWLADQRSTAAAELAKAEQQRRLLMARFGASHKRTRRVAHDMRNPLQALELMTSLLGMDPTEEELSELAASIREEIRNLDGIAGRTLGQETEGGIPLVKRTEADLSEVLRWPLRGLGAEAHKRGLTFEHDAMTTLSVKADLDIVVRVIEDAVRQGFDAIDDGQGSQLSVVVRANDKNAIVRVDDDGPTMEGRFLDTLSGRTFRRHTMATFVRDNESLARSMGGRLFAYPSPKGGARVELHLPLSQ